MKDYDVIECYSALTGSGRELVKYFIEDPRVGAMVFYGESEPGFQVLSKASLNAEKVLVELAGNDPCIIWGDVDITYRVRWCTCK